MRLLSSITTLSFGFLRRFNSNFRIMSTESTLKKIYNQTDRNIFSFYVTGGGAEFAHWVFTVPGASNSIIEGSVPYSRESLTKIINKNLVSNFTGACTADTALHMAHAAYLNTVNTLLSSDIDLSAISSANIF